MNTVKQEARQTLRQHWANTKIKETFYHKFKRKEGNPPEHIGVQPGKHVDDAVKSFNEIPGPKGLPYFGLALHYSKLGPYDINKMTELRSKFQKQYGNIYKEKIGPLQLVHVFDPKDICTVMRKEGKFPKRGLSSALIDTLKTRSKFDPGMSMLHGPEWWNQRRVVQQEMLKPDATSLYLDAQAEVADDFVVRLRGLVVQNPEITNFYDELFRYTMESIGTICFNTRLNSFDPNNKEAEAIVHATREMFALINKSLTAVPLFTVMRTPMYNTAEKHLSCLFGNGRKYIENALQTVAEKERNGTFSESEPNFILSLLGKKELGYEDMVSLTMSLFGAGIDSTANSLAFLLYHIAKNEDKQEILRKEINETIVPGERISAEQLNKMRYLRACLKESFRLVFPTMSGPMRVLEEDVVLSGYHIPKGTNIICGNGVMCTHEAYFDEPLKFLPERWLRDLGYTRKPGQEYINIPFGHGRRNCIGRRFAEQEMNLTIVKLLQNFKLEYHHEDIGRVDQSFTAPDRPLKLTFRELN